MALFAVAISAAVNTRPIITVSRYRGARLYDANGDAGFFLSHINWVVKLPFVFKPLLGTSV